MSDVLKGAIDCDVHPSVPGIEAFLPYLDDYWHAAEEAKGGDMAIQKGLRRLCRISLHKTGIGMGQIKAEEMDLALDTADDPERLPEIDLSMPWRMQQRHEHLSDTHTSAAYIILHRHIAAIKAMLVTKTIVNPLRR